MGMYDDYKVDEIFRSQYPHGVNNDEWTTKEGKILKIKDMTNAHIRNCMRMIGQNDDFWYAFEAELKRRGEPVRLNDCDLCPVVKSETELAIRCSRLEKKLRDCERLLPPVSIGTPIYYVGYGNSYGDSNFCEYVVKKAFVSEISCNQSGWHFTTTGHSGAPYKPSDIGKFLYLDLADAEIACANMNAHLLSIIEEAEWVTDAPD